MRWLYVAVLAVIGASMVMTGLARADVVVSSGGEVRLNYLYVLDPTCASLGEAKVNVIDQPRSGHIDVRRGHDYPNYQTSNVRVKCDTEKVDVVEVVYRSNPGFVGSDHVEYEALYPTGELRRYTVDISVR